MTVRFGVFMAVRMVISLFQVLVLRRITGRCQHFRETFCLLLQGRSDDAGKQRDLYRLKGRKG
jgi:hypothetical protein